MHINSNCQIPPVGEEEGANLARGPTAPPFTEWHFIQLMKKKSIALIICIDFTL